MATGEFIDLRHLCFCDFPREDTANAAATGVYVEHYLGRLFAVHGKEYLQHFDDKIHRCVVIVQQKDSKQRWAFDFRLGRFNCQAVVMFMLVLRRFRITHSAHDSAPRGRFE